jgi:hypothetical protein
MHTSSNETGTNPEQFSQWLQFKQNLIQLWEILARHGVKKPAITDKNYPRFTEMTKEQRSLVTSFVVKQIEIYNEAEKNELDFDNTPDLLRVALKVMGLVVDSKVFELIDRRDIVELYSVEHIQLFRSFNFFRVCNYNLDDVLMYEWFNLYERERSDTDAIFNAIIGHLAETACINNIKVPPHDMKERFSDPQGRFEITFKYIASAFKGAGVRDAYILTQKAKTLPVPDRPAITIV